MANDCTAWRIVVGSPINSNATSTPRPAVSFRICSHWIRSRGVDGNRAEPFRHFEFSRIDIDGKHLRRAKCFAN